MIYIIGLAYGAITVYLLTCTVEKIRAMTVRPNPRKW